MSKDNKIMDKQQNGNDFITDVSGCLSQQSEIVRQRLHYHFAKVGGGWNIEGMNAPFMKEFLNEIQKLVDLSKCPLTVCVWCVASLT
jgi:hypothetical protein